MHGVQKKPLFYFFEFQGAWTSLLVKAAVPEQGRRSLGELSLAFVSTSRMLREQGGVMTQWTSLLVARE